MRRHEAVAREKKSIPGPLKASVAVELKVRIGVMRRFPVLEGDFFRPERFRRGRKANNFYDDTLKIVPGRMDSQNECWRSK